MYFILDWNTKLLHVPRAERAQMSNHNSNQNYVSLTLFEFTKYVLNFSILNAGQGASSNAVPPPAAPSTLPKSGGQLPPLSLQ